MASTVSFCFVAFFLLLVASSFTSIYAEDSESKEFVLTLDHANFHDTVTKHDLIVVEFYAPWCGHCKKLAPEYEKAASILSSHDPPVVLAKVDLNEEANKGLANEFQIEGFPTIKILRNGGKISQEYKGPRDTEGIVNYLKRQTGPASAEIKTVEDASSLISDKKIVIVGIFPKYSGEEFENYTALTEKLRSDFEFAHTLDAKLLPGGETSLTGPIIRLFKPFDELFTDFQDFEVEALEKFVQESSVPLVTIYNNDPSNHPYLEKYFNNANAKAMLFLKFSSEVTETFESEYRRVAAQYKGEGISFLIGDVDAAQGALQYFSLREDQVPLIIIQNGDGEKYLKPNLKPDDVAPWVKEYKDGNVAPYIKSQPIPEHNDEPVKVVVADSLQDIVFNSGKNVLLEFYAPWCGHCKNLAPILDEVAVSFESDPDVIIAKLDGTTNDYPRKTFKVVGYPTLYFKRASGNLTEYEGDRTKEGIIDFIQKNRDSTTVKDTTTQEEQRDLGEKDEL